jgi:hypothetical protein
MMLGAPEEMDTATNNPLPKVTPRHTFALEVGVLFVQLMPSVEVITFVVTVTDATATNVPLPYATLCQSPRGALAMNQLVPS